jgi:hypothetical protein
MKRNFRLNAETCQKRKYMDTTVNTGKGLYDSEVLSMLSIGFELACLTCCGLK